MKLFIISLASKEHSVMPQCAKDALTCANRFSGCDVIALTDMPTEGWQDATPYMGSLSAFKEKLLNVLKKPLQRFFPMSARYFIMEEYIAKHSVSEPVFNCDWDILVFSDLPEHFKSVGGFDTDLCSCLMRHSGQLQAPMLINNLSSIRFYTDMIRGYLDDGYSDNLFFCDITQWIEVRKKGMFTDSASCSTLNRDTYFDFNIGMEGEVFHMKDGGKDIAWQNGVPYFKRKDSTLVRAVNMHCFSGWRTKTSTLIEKSISGYSDA